MASRKTLSNIENLRASFRQLNLPQQKAFIEGLTKQAAKLKKREYNDFLRECAWLYNQGVQYENAMVKWRAEEAKAEKQRKQEEVRAARQHAIELHRRKKDERRLSQRRGSSRTAPFRRTGAASVPSPMPAVAPKQPKQEFAFCIMCGFKRMSDMPFCIGCGVRHDAYASQIYPQAQQASYPQRPQAAYPQAQQTSYPQRPQMPYPSRQPAHNYDFCMTCGDRRIKENVFCIVCGQKYA